MQSITSWDKEQFNVIKENSDEGENMKNSNSILPIIAISFLFSGCTLQTEDEYFSADGYYTVNCLNAKSMNSISDEEHYFTENKEYYYTDKYGGDLYRYSIEDNKNEHIMSCPENTRRPLIQGEYFYYPDDSEVYRYDLQTKETQKIFEETYMTDISLDIYGKYLYIQDYQTERAYRMDIEDDRNVQAEELGNFLPQAIVKSIEPVQVELDGVVIQGYCNYEDDWYRITSIRTADMNRRIISGDTEIKVDDKYVKFIRNKRYPNTPYNYRVDGGLRKSINCFDKADYKNSDLYEQYMYQDGEETIIGLMNVSGYPLASIDLSQQAIKRDVLFSLNIDTGESQILYNTKNNQTRIVGYEDGILYLFKKNYKVYKQPLSGGEVTEILSIPKSNDVVFDWCEDYLIVRYRDTNSRTDNICPPYDVQAVKVK